MKVDGKGTLTLSVLLGLNFTHMLACNRPTKRTLSAEEQNAIAALKKVDAATQVGISYTEYGKLLIDAQDRVNYVKRTPEDAVANHIFDSMEAYKQALLAWKITISERRDYISDFELPNGLMEKYQFYKLPESALGVENGWSQMGTVRKDVALSIMWKHAACELTLIDAEIDKSASDTSSVLSCRKLLAKDSNGAPTQQPTR